MTALITSRPNATILTAVPEVDARDWTITAPSTGELGDDLVHLATTGGRHLPVEVDHALAHFASNPPRSGALLIRNVPLGALPETPERPDAVVDKDLATELGLLTVARRLGQPVGYVPEHGGRIVQNLVPTRSDTDRQTSTSSRSNLMFHTETAFHPHRPRHLLLLCLRGDPSAHTTLASVYDIMDHLSDDVVATLFEPRFRTAADVSFLAGRRNELGPVRPVITGTRSEPTFVFDADLTVGVDDGAEDALAAVRAAIEHVQTSVVLEAGDLLVVDNNIAVHGRSPFVARFDGTDRWLQRAFVVADLAPSAGERNGRVITTEFGRL